MRREHKKEETVNLPLTPRAVREERQITVYGFLKTGRSRRKSVGQQIGLHVLLLPHV